MTQCSVPVELPDLPPPPPPPAAAASEVSSATAKSQRDERRMAISWARGIEWFFEIGARRAPPQRSELGFAHPVKRCRERQSFVATRLQGVRGAPGYWKPTA